MRWTAWIALVMVPALVVPMGWLPAYWTSRDLQAFAVPLVALLAVALVLGQSPGPFRAVALLLVALGASVSTSGLQGSLALLPLLGILAGAVLVLLWHRLSPAVLPTALAALGALHLAALAGQGIGLHVQAWIWYGATPVRSVRPWGLADNPLVGVGLLLLTLPWAVAWCAEARRARAGGPWRPALGRIGGDVILLGSLTALVLSRQWTAMLGLGVLGIVWLVAIRLLRPAGLALASVLALLPAAGYAAWVKSPLVSLPERWTVITLALSRPLGSVKTALLGHGLGSWWLFGWSRPLRQQTYGMAWETVHNDWVQLWYEAGLVGVVAFALVAVAVIRAFWHQRRTIVGKAGIASTAVWLLLSLTLFPAWIATLALPGMALLVIAQHTAEAPDA